MALTVLVVEDDPVISDLLVLTLELEDWTVRSATEAPSALASVHEHPPDVVLSDVLVPAASALPPARR